MSDWEYTVCINWFKIVMDGPDIWNWVFVTRNRLNTCWKYFLHFFCQNFDDFSKFLSAIGKFHFEKSSKNLEKPCSTCSSPKPDFWKLSPSLIANCADNEKPRNKNMQYWKNVVFVHSVLPFHVHVCQLAKIKSIQIHFGS